MSTLNFQQFPLKSKEMSATATTATTATEEDAELHARLDTAEEDMDADDEDSSSTMSFTTIAEALEQMNVLLEDMYCEAEALEEELLAIHPSLEGLMLDQFGEASFLASSPFRTATFAVKRGGIAGLEPRHRYTYGQICGALRAHLERTGAIAENGLVTLSDDLRHLFEVQDRSMPYIALLGKLTHFLI